MGALRSNTSGSFNSAGGVNALYSNTTASNNVAVGYGAMYANTTGTSNTAVGYNALYANVAGNSNTAMGYSALASLNGGSANTAAGQEALGNLGGTSSNNTALGYRAGQNLTSGDSNIIIGSSVDAPSATGSNQLNIGNTIYGDLSTDSINIGSSTMVSGISLDVGSKTDSTRTAVGTTAQRPTCDASHRAVDRWNTSLGTWEFCDGSNWVSPILATGGMPGPQSTPGSGYFVLTQSTWDGNLGGLSGAASKCLTELTTNTNWKGYAAANAAGQLVAGKVFAFLCGYSYNCTAPLPLTTYSFARVGDNTVGGVSFTTNVDQSVSWGTAPWSAPNYFGGAYDYWTGNGSAGVPMSTTLAHSNNYHCTNWTENTTSAAAAGNSNMGSYAKWYQTLTGCSTSKRLICWVNP